MTAKNDTNADGKEAVDSEAARKIARCLIAEELKATDDAVLGQFIQKCDQIRCALEEDEEPHPGDIEAARWHAEQLRTHLLDAGRIYGYSDWDLGVQYGELSEEEQCRVKQEKNHV